MSKGPLTDGSTSSPILSSPGPLSSVEGAIDQRFDKLTDPKQPRIPERQSKGPYSQAAYTRIAGAILGAKVMKGTGI